MSSTRTARLARAALIAALIGVGALIAIPIGPVPVTLQVLVVAVATLVLAPSEALVALLLYVALGAIGAPVFSGGGAGVGVLLGPTGGFIGGFALGAPAGALVRRFLAGKAGSPPRGDWRAVGADCAAIGVLLSITYLAGWAYFMFVTGRAAGEAFALAVGPFIVIDLAKGVVAMLIARGLRAAGLARS